MNIQPAFQSTTALTPLPKSAAAATRMSGEVSSPATIGTRSRNQTVARPTCSMPPRDGRDLHRARRSSSVRPARTRTAPRLRARSRAGRRLGSRPGSVERPSRGSASPVARATSVPSATIDASIELHLLARPHRAGPHVERAERDRSQQLDREPGDVRRRARARAARSPGPAAPTARRRAARSGPTDPARARSRRSARRPTTPSGRKTLSGIAIGGSLRRRLDAARPVRTSCLLSAPCSGCCWTGGSR